MDLKRIGFIILVLCVLLFLQMFFLTSLQDTSGSSSRQSAAAKSRAASHSSQGGAAPDVFNVNDDERTTLSEAQQFNGDRADHRGESQLLPRIPPRTAQHPSPMLRFTEAASSWRNVLPIGNGRLGALLAGDPVYARIPISEDTHYQGTWESQPEDINELFPEANWNGKREALMQARDELLKGGAGADVRAERAAEKLYHFDIYPYEYAAEIHLNLVDPGDLVNAPYGERTLNLDTGVHQVVFGGGGGTSNCSRTSFASAVDNVVVFHIDCPQVNAVEVKLMRARDVKSASILGESEGVCVSGKLRNGAGLKFSTCVAVVGQNPGGSKSGDASVIVTLPATLVVASETSWKGNGADPTDAAIETLNAARSQSYNVLLQRHLAEFSPLMDSSRLILRGGDEHESDSELRLKAASMAWRQDDQADPDPGLIELFWTTGRYLLLGSSRGNSAQPANLQGIWTDGVDSAPWGGDFHANINLQMCYWASGPANLPNTIPPLTRYLQRLARNGEHVALRLYDVPQGWVAHGFTDIWTRPSFNAAHTWSLCPVCGAWAALALWDQYEFFPDAAWLESTAYPMLKGAAQFFIHGGLVEANDGTGDLVTAPSTLPETQVSPGISVAISPALDAAVLDLLFRVVAEAGKLVGDSHWVESVLLPVFDRLPPVGVVGTHGRLLEYPRGDASAKELDPSHRHWSQWFPLFPGDARKLDMDAAKASLEHRLAAGGGHTGWSRAWSVSLAARLQDAALSNSNLAHLLGRLTAGNMLSIHGKLVALKGRDEKCVTCVEPKNDDETNAFASELKRSTLTNSNSKECFQGAESVEAVWQLDGTMGGVAGITEMLVQSHERSSATQARIIRLLPAWSRSGGSAMGLRCRGGLTLDMDWSSGGRLNAAMIAADLHISTQQLLIVGPLSVALEAYLVTQREHLRADGSPGTITVHRELPDGGTQVEFRSTVFNAVPIQGSLIDSSNDSPAGLGLTLKAGQIMVIISKE